MRLKQDAMQIENREKAIWTAPVLKKGAVGCETALNIRLITVLAIQAIPR